MANVLGTIKFIEELLTARQTSPVIKEQLTLLRQQIILLESEKSILTDKVKDLQAEADKKAKIIEVNRETIDDLKRQRDDSASQLEVFHKAPPLEYNPKTGTWVDEATQIHYCPSCKSKNIFAPLQERVHGWQCNIKECDKFYQNPDKSGDITYATVSSSRRRQLDRHFP